MEEHGRIWTNIVEPYLGVGGMGDVTNMDEHGRTWTNMVEHKGSLGPSS